MSRFKKKKGVLETQATYHFPEVSTVIYCFGKMSFGKPTLPLWTILILSVVAEVC